MEKQQSNENSGTPDLAPRNSALDSNYSVINKPMGLKDWAGAFVTFGTLAFLLLTGGPESFATEHNHNPPDECELVTETFAQIPTNRDRTKLGVGEDVSVTLPLDLWGPTDWSISGPGDLSDETEFEAKFTAAYTASSATVTATNDVDDWTCSVTFDVVEPASLTGVKMTDFPHGAGYAMMRIELTVEPTDVSFYKVAIKELPGPASSITGYWSNYPDPSVLDHEPYENFVGLTEENKYCCDTAGINLPDPGPFPWEPGSFEYIIPVVWTIDTNEEGKQFDTVTQLFEMLDTNGNVRITKFGEVTP